MEGFGKNGAINVQVPFERCAWRLKGPVINGTRPLFIEIYLEEWLSLSELILVQRTF
jgi:hypothetical protein